MDEFAKRALDEYNSEENLIKPGGVNGNSFWNVNASQFIYVPSFEFHKIPAASKYEYTATDCKGNTHSFISDSLIAPLTPIWKDIPVGMVTLKVEGIHRISGEKYLSGTRTFFKAAPFPGRADLPERARSYKECAEKALEYTFKNGISQHWLKHGLPDPDYYHNVYPSKMIRSLVNAMLSYAELKPEIAGEALKLATNAADYLISITYGENYGTCDLPPTYSLKDMNMEVVKECAPAAINRQDSVMMIYPAQAGSMYLALEKATGDKKYFEAARRIADYYKRTVRPNGSWYLMVSKRTGEPEAENYCCDFGILKFLNAFYKRTNEPCWQTLEQNYFEYLLKNRCEPFNWEGQFEDSYIGRSYVNLTHYPAGHYLEYLVENYADKPDTENKVRELMRFIEDQFVVWGEFAPWSDHHYDMNEKWVSPAGLEQYHWYVPIDASTAEIMLKFLTAYEFTKDELFLEKAKALGDSITRMQVEDSGVFPTHWMWNDCKETLQNFWLNCHIYTAFAMMKLAKAVGEI